MTKVYLIKYAQKLLALLRTSMLIHINIYTDTDTDNDEDDNNDSYDVDDDYLKWENNRNILLSGGATPGRICPGRNTSVLAGAVNSGINKVIYQDISTAVADATNDLSLPCHVQWTLAAADPIPVSAISCELRTPLNCRCCQKGFPYTDAILYIRTCI